MKKLIHKKYFPYILLIIATFLIGFPLLRFKMLDGHDASFHFFRTYSFKIALEDGQLLPFINPNMMGGLGFAANLFYGILSSVVTFFISLFTPSWGLAVNLGIFFSIYLSGVTMYQFLWDVSGKRRIAILGAFLYMIAPYHLYDIYVRMALGEIFAFVFLPLVFHGIYDIVNHDGRKWYLVTIGTAGLFLTHLVSTVMVGFFAFLFLLFYGRKRNLWELVKKLGISLGIAIFLALPSFLPLLEAKLSSDYMVFDNVYMKTTGYHMEKRALSIFSFSHDYLVQSVQCYILLLFFIALIIIFKRKQESFQNTFFLASFSLLFLSLFLTLKIIPWASLPNVLSIFQFPWRYLQLSSFFGAIVLSIFLSKVSRQHLFSIGLAVVFLAMAVPMLQKGIQNKGVDNQLIHTNDIRKRGEIARSVGTASAEYLPRNAIYNYDYLKKRSLEPIVLKGNSHIMGVEKEGTHLSFSIEVEEESIIELPFIYYPGYQIKNGKEKIASFETQNGLLGITLKPGTYEITTFYQGTLWMILSYGISLVTFLIFSFLIYWTKKERMVFLFFIFPVEKVF